MLGRKNRSISAEGKKLRPLYISLFRLDRFDEDLRAFYVSSSLDLRGIIIRSIRLSEASLILDNNVKTEDAQDFIINSALRCYSKSGYAEFVTYIQNEILKEVALNKGHDKDFIHKWKEKESLSWTSEATLR